MTQIIPDIINIVIEAIFAILGLFFTGVAVPWLIKTGIPWLKDQAPVRHCHRSGQGGGEAARGRCAAHPEVRLCGADA